MIAAAKTYFKQRLAAAGVPDGVIYLDASETKRHSAPPWASVLTPMEREAEEFERLDRVEHKIFRDEDDPDPDARDTWLILTRRFDHTLYLDVEIAAATVAEADSLKRAFLLALEKYIWLDPDHPDGYTTDPSALVGNRNWRTSIEVASAVWSDSLAHIKNEAHVSLRLILRGAIMVEEIQPVITKTTIDATMDGEEAG